MTTITQAIYTARKNTPVKSGNKTDYAAFSSFMNSYVAPTSIKQAETFETKFGYKYLDAEGRFGLEPKQVEDPAAVASSFVKAFCATHEEKDLATYYDKCEFSSAAISQKIKGTFKALCLKKGMSPQAVAWSIDNALTYGLTPDVKRITRTANARYLTRLMAKEGFFKFDEGFEHILTLMWFDERATVNQVYSSMVFMRNNGLDYMNADAVLTDIDNRLFAIGR